MTCTYIIYIYTSRKTRSELISVLDIMCTPKHIFRNVSHTTFFSGQIIRYHKMYVIRITIHLRYIVEIDRVPPNDIHRRFYVMLFMGDVIYNNVTIIIIRKYMCCIMSCQVSGRLDRFLDTFPKQTDRTTDYKWTIFYIAE